MLFGLPKKNNNNNDLLIAGAAIAGLLGLYVLFGRAYGQPSPTPVPPTPQPPTPTPQPPTPTPQPPVPTPTPMPPTPTPSPITGQVTVMNLAAWSPVDFANFRWDAITDVTVFSYIPNPDGTWNYRSNAVWNPQTAINTARLNGRRCSLSLGGWLGTNGDGNFPTILNNSILRSASAQNVVNEVVAKGYDGVKIDVESANMSALWNGLVLWISELRRLLPADRHIYWDVFQGGAGWHIEDAEPYVDKILVMNFNGQAYDPRVSMPLYANRIPSSSRNKLVVGQRMDYVTPSQLDSNLAWGEANGYGGGMFWVYSLTSQAQYDVIRNYV